MRKKGIALEKGITKILFWQVILISKHIRFYLLENSIDPRWNRPLNYHRESKFDGNIGKLERKHLKINSVIHIGKETNNLEETEVVGVQKDDYQVYQNEKVREEKLEETIMALTPKTTKKYGISRMQLYRWKKKIREREELRLYKKTRGKIGKLI